MRIGLVSDRLFDLILGRMIPSPEGIHAQVRDLRTQMPGATDDEICDRLIANAAARAAAIGAGFTAPAEIPGAGTVLAWFGVPGELVALWSVQATLILQIASVYGHDVRPQSRRAELIYLLGLVTTPTLLSEEGLRSLISVGGMRVVRQLSARIGMSGLERIGARTLGLLAIAADAGLNMAATVAVGQRAKAYFSRHAKLVLNGQCESSDI